jgi:hypothetical protein
VRESENTTRIQHKSNTIYDGQVVFFAAGRFDFLEDTRRVRRAAAMDNYFQQKYICQRKLKWKNMITPPVAHHVKPNCRPAGHAISKRTLVEHHFVKLILS